MSRRTFRLVLGALVLAGGLLSLAPPPAEAAGAAQEPDGWSLVLRWAAELWDAKVAFLWETQGWQPHPGEGEPPAPPSGQTSDEGWMLDPNG